MLVAEPLLTPDRIGTDSAGSQPPAIAETCKVGLLPRTPTHHVTKHLQQSIESDYFRVKRAMPRAGGFLLFNTARRRIQGFEAILWLRKGLRVRGRMDRAGAEPAARHLLWASRREQGVKMRAGSPFYDLNPSLRHAPVDQVRGPPSFVVAPRHHGSSAAMACFDKTGLANQPGNPLATVSLALVAQLRLHAPRAVGLA